MPPNDIHALLKQNPSCIEAVDNYLKARGKPGLHGVPVEVVPAVVAAVLDGMVEDELNELLRVPGRQLEEETARSLNLLDDLAQCGVRPWTLAQLERFLEDAERGHEPRCEAA
jgi:hypothetical protein